MILRTPQLPRAWRSHSAAVIATSVLCAVAFYAIEHSYTMSEYVESVEAEVMTEDDELELDEIVAAGNMLRRLAFAGLGACGLVGWYLRGTPTPFRWTSGGVILLAYFGWCFASLLWAVDPGMTLRRFGVLGFFCLAVMGLSKQFTPSDLAWIVIGVAASHVGLGVLVEMQLGTFQPGSSHYRFSGTVHPNTQGIQCAALCLASFTMLPYAGRRRWVLWLLVFAGGLFLMLTKSRTSCAALVLVLLLLWLPRAPLWVKATLLVGPPAIGGAVLLLLILGDFDVADRITGVVLMGRQEEAGTLTGRIPLWNELMPYVQQRSLLGYGYGGFWNPQRTRLISESQGWQIAHSHSAYFENLLNLGLVGLMLAVVPGWCALVRAARRYLGTADPGAGFACGMLVFAALYSVTDAGFALPGFMTLILATCIARLLFYDDRVEALERIPAAPRAIPRLARGASS